MTDHSVMTLQQRAAAARSQPESAAARYLYGCSLATAGHNVEAVAEFRKTLQLDPTLYTAVFQLGLLYLTMGRVDEAAGAWRGLDPLPEDHSLQRFRAGLLAMLRGDWAMSVAAIEAGMLGQPQNLPLNSDMAAVADQIRSRLTASTDRKLIDPGTIPVRTDFSLYHLDG